MPGQKAPTLNSRQLIALLKLSNAEPPFYGAGVGQAKLMEMLQSIPPLAKGDNAGLLARLERYYPEPVLSINEILILSFVDDCMREIITRASLDRRLEWLILRFSPHVALFTVAKGPTRLFDSFPAFDLIDQICEYCVGWSSDLGILGELSVEKVEKLIEEIPVDHKAQKEHLKELKEYFQGEYERFADREALFTQTELAKLESAAAKDTVARLINQEMEGYQYGFFIVILLQGEWLDFAQSVLLEKGLKSKAWKAAHKLTRMLIWSLREHDQGDVEEQQRLRDVITTLPSRIRALDQSVYPDNPRAENAVLDVEAEYEAILNGRAAEREEFTPIEIQGLALGDDSGSSVSRDMEIDGAPGEWFLYEDLDHESSRLKLILLWQNKQLLFTNHNHKSAISIGYADFYRSLAAARIRKLPAVPRCNEIVRQYVEQLLNDQRQKKAEAARLKKEKLDLLRRRKKEAQELQRLKKEEQELQRQEKEAQDSLRRQEKEEQDSLRRQLAEARQRAAAAEAEVKNAELPLAKRKAALAKEIEAVRQEEVTQEQEEVSREQTAEEMKLAAEKALEDARNAVRGLGIGAEIKLESESGAVIECKLLTIMSSMDRYIFVDRDGVRVAQHSQEELTKLHLDTKLEILSSGEEFEDTLASVVRGLREDRDKIMGDE